MLILEEERHLLITTCSDWEEWQLKFKADRKKMTKCQTLQWKDDRNKKQTDKLSTNSDTYSLYVLGNYLTFLNAHFFICKDKEMITGRVMKCL